MTVLDRNMTAYNGIEVSPASIIGKGMILLRVNKSFDYEAHTSVDLVVKWFYSHFILLKLYK